MLTSQEILTSQGILTSEEIPLIFGSRMATLRSYKPVYFAHPEPDQPSPIPYNEALLDSL